MAMMAMVGVVGVMAVVAVMTAVGMVAVMGVMGAPRRDAYSQAEGRERSHRHGLGVCRPRCQRARQDHGPDRFAAS